MNKSFVIRIFLSTVLAVIVYILIPFNPYPKVVDIIRDDPHAVDSTLLKMADMDGDGRDEMIKGFRNTSRFYCFQVIGPEGGVPYQRNLSCSENQPRINYHIGDYNRNNLPEIVTVYSVGDLMYLSVLAVYDSTFLNQERVVFLDTMQTAPGFVNKFDWYAPVWFDLNGDDFDEVIIPLFGSFETYYPRKLIAYDIKNDSLWASMPFNNMIGNIFVFDHEGDGDYEISGRCGAPDNNKSSHMDYPLHDQSSWLLIFNKDLELKFPEPIEFSGVNTSIIIYPREINGKTELVGWCKHLNTGNGPDYLFETRNLREICRKDTIPQYEGRLGVDMRPMNQDDDFQFAGIQGLTHLIFVNSNLLIEKSKKLPDPSILFGIEDICDGPKSEIITKNYQTNLLRFNKSSGRQIAEHYFNKPHGIASIGKTNFLGEPTAYAHFVNTVVFYKLINNPWYYLRWLILIAIISTLYYFSWFSMLLQKRQSERQIAIMNRMRKLELLSINSQLDPHFTFNALNVLNYLSSQGDNEGVERFSFHFSKVIRKQLESSDRPSHKLSEELEFIHHYIQLQKLRFDIPIEVDQTVASEVDQNLLIPKMLIHTHVENAIKHGLLPSLEGGTIFLTISSQKGETIISIRDDGVGRKMVAKSDPARSSGKGLKILDQLIDLFYQLTKTKITQKFIDHTNSDGKPSGTEVVIKIYN